MEAPIFALFVFSLSFSAFSRNKVKKYWRLFFINLHTESGSYSIKMAFEDDWETNNY